MSINKETKVKEFKNSAPVENDIIDVQINAIKRKKFRLNGDNDKIIELNTSDLGIAERLEKGYTELQNIITKVSNLDTEDDGKFSEKLDKYNADMKAQIDYIFDSEVAEKACDGGTMYDPYNGTYRFEHIIKTLLRLYENNLNNEFNAIKRRVQKHTNKYTGKR